MTTIIDVLKVEHRVFHRLFHQVESLQPRPQSLAEVRQIGRLIEGLLEAHRDTENSLAYRALDHVLAQRGRLDRLYQDHEEIDSRFHKLQSARDLPEAMRLLTEAVAAMRTHFEHEERVDFPLLEQTLMAETIGQLGTAWME
jgi:uncharacterized protein YdcH (DUF465 family)